MTVSHDRTEKKRICIGMLAHVDAGKTTLSESILYLSGKIRKAGRVDHGDAYLDTFALEKERGITIFSKQAVMELPKMCITLLDTPGHVDFSAEMERTLTVLDYGVLIVSGADGVQGHTLTLWKLLEKYRVPVFIFVNKMDQPGTERERILSEIRKKLSDACIPFDESQTEEFQENLAMQDEMLMEKYLDGEKISASQIQQLIQERRVFPVYFGSALKMTGMEELLEGFQTYMRMPSYSDSFGARIFKIARDEKGNRLTYLKVTGGRLKVKMVLSNEGSAVLPEEIWNEKADQLRVYSGASFELVQEAEPGMVCAVTGLSSTFPGQGLGTEKSAELPVLEPVLSYQIIPPAGYEIPVFLKNLKQLEEEDPQLHIVWDEKLQEIHAMLMGDVQIEILKKLIYERFHVAAEFGAGSVVYKETIADSVEGVGHFEPLRHYAEVHLLLEPGERGSGLQFYTACSEDVLNRNWQRLILTHLEEKEHKGVLTGASVTDLQITLLTGRAHLKHTEGGDFRQATYRAVRQGLKKAKSVLLEPYYEFTMELPSDMIGRAMSDVQKMQGEFLPPMQEGERSILRGSAPVSRMRDYQSTFVAYSRGLGHLFLSLKGYEPCKDQEEVVRRIGYDSERDLDNPTGSVFCAHGAGFVVPWYEVEDYMHLERQTEVSEMESQAVEQKLRDTYGGSDSYADEEELRAIFERTYGTIRRNLPQEQKRVYRAPEPKYRAPGKKKNQEEYLLVDGYNIMYAWEELRSLMEVNLSAAQDRLKEILSNYQGIIGGTLILVFDAYKVKGHAEEVLKHHNIYVVYTKEAETADQYIEKTVHRIGRDHHVTVATSDGLEQIIILGQGGRRLSASGLREEIASAENNLREVLHEKRRNARSYLLDEVSGEVAAYIDQLKE